MKFFCRAPRYVYALTAVAISGLVIAVLVAWQIQSYRAAEAQRDCERAVATRDDGRAMWLYLTDTATEDPERVAAFVKKLNELLPPLKCVNGDPVPRN